MSWNSSRSASSGGRPPKRSLTNSSSDNSGGRDDKKRKCSKQKTLGMAWGANSLPASRSSSFRSSPFSDFSSYMVEKNRKLQNQFDAAVSGSSTSLSIFQGVSIFVDGLTIPSSQELRGYMLKHGGRFENYFSRRRVTHIICSNLPDSKIKNLRSFSRGLPVVKPSWIVDSIAANKLLEWVPYQLDQLASNQPKLSAFFALKSNPVPEDALTDAVCQQILDPSLNGGTSTSVNSSELGGFLEDGKKMDQICDHLEHETEEPSSSSGSSLELKTDNPGHSDTDNELSVNNEIQPSPHRLCSPVGEHFLDNETTKRSSSSVTTGPSIHSTAEDPNFVENYFKVLEVFKKEMDVHTLRHLAMVRNFSLHLKLNDDHQPTREAASCILLELDRSSRLHFIGTWRNRYRKHFPSISSEFKGKSPNANLSENAQKTTILHIDMDCFFVSVVIRNHPELHNKPVAVCHSNNPRGTAEISSANYPARHYGVKAGMFVRDAKALCPELTIFPYNFKAYEEVADQFYHILHKHCSKVQAVSCDEAFLDITDSEEGNHEILASTIRKEILETTGCTASVGIAENMLMARLATRGAKPDGQCYISPEKVHEYLDQLPVKALPGIGYVIAEKLKQQNILTCGQLRLISKEALQKDFGQKTGEMLWNYSRGVDNRLVGAIQEIKSIGAEVNWGVRFKDFQDSQRFLSNLCKEVSLRLQGCGVLGRTFTLKIKKRRKDAEEPVKYMGCGDCENLSHSVTVPMATDDTEVLERVAKKLFGSFCLDVKEIRGVGLQVSKLEGAETFKQGIERNSLKSWLTSTSATTYGRSFANCKPREISDIDSATLNLNGNSGLVLPNRAGLLSEINNNLSSIEAYSNSRSTPPPLCSLDVGVVESLPPELFSELNESYGGKLVEFIAKSREKHEKICGSSILAQKEVTGAVGDASVKCLPSTRIVKEKAAEYAQAAQAFEAGPHDEAILTGDPCNTALMPSSLSQVDISVLQQLPEELRTDILGLLPAHRRQDSYSIAGFEYAGERFLEPVITRTADNQSIPFDCFLKNNMWEGNPPYWVDKFRVSNCLIFKTFSEIYLKLGAPGNLSPILQRVISDYPASLDESSDCWSDDDNNVLCEFFKQYIELKIEYDIEEIDMCFRTIKRFAAKSKRFSRVYESILPYLQASVGEHYGGKLHIFPNR